MANLFFSAICCYLKIKSKNQINHTLWVQLLFVFSFCIFFWVFSDNTVLLGETSLYWIREVF